MNELILFSNKEEALLFRAIGFAVHIISKEEEILSILNGKKEEFKVIAFDPFFTPFFAAYKMKQKSLYPLFISLPLSEGDNGIVISQMKENIRKSIGIDLL